MPHSADEKRVTVANILQALSQARTIVAMACEYGPEPLEAGQVAGLWHTTLGGVYASLDELASMTSRCGGRDEDVELIFALHADAVRLSSWLRSSLWRSTRR